MDTIQKRYGYTGQGLRVNLTTGKITKEPGATHEFIC